MTGAGQSRCNPAIALPRKRGKNRRLGAPSALLPMIRRDPAEREFRSGKPRNRVFETTPTCERAPVALRLCPVQIYVESDIIACKSAGELWDSTLRPLTRKLENTIRKYNSTADERTSHGHFSERCKMIRYMATLSLYT